ncbi:MAG: Fur family transcriptional regulator [Vampirovibrionales bacterium]
MLCSASSHPVSTALPSEYMHRSLEVLKQNQFRITRPRKLILRVLDEAEVPLSVYEIHDYLTTKLQEKMDVVSVYRVVDCLLENHLVHNIMSANKYRKCLIAHSHHPSLSHQHHHPIAAPHEHHGTPLETHDHGHHTVAHEGVTRLSETMSCHCHNPHYLLYCKSCQKVDEVQIPELQPLLQLLERQKHFTIQEPKLELIGLCQSCLPRHDGHTPTVSPTSQVEVRFLPHS